MAPLVTPSSHTQHMMQIRNMMPPQLRRAVSHENPVAAKFFAQDRFGAVAD
jgi:hypothetical protein